MKLTAVFLPSENTDRCPCCGDPTKSQLEVDVRAKKLSVNTGNLVIREMEKNSDYELLINKPKLNGVTIQGDHDSAYYHIDQTYVHTQGTAADLWTIQHNLGKYPSVTVVDSAGTVVVGDVHYIDTNTLECSFSGAFSGIAYLN